MDQFKILRIRKFNVVVGLNEIIVQVILAKMMFHKMLPSKNWKYKDKLIGFEFSKKSVKYPGTWFLEF